MIDPYVTSVIDDITRLLTPIGFVLEQDVAAGEGVGRATWRRENSWKVDVVELVQKPVSPHRFFISNSVYLKGTDIPERIFDGFTLEGLSRGASFFSIPMGLGRVLWTPARFAASVAKRVSGQLHWFDDLASPERCLCRLRTGDTNGAGSGGRAFEIIEATLEESIPTSTLATTQ